jgi:predicted dithiol-disulfide oxidoreductase (DUF899 family)/predicted enzyme related to lactoylglutathione lyase
MAQSAQKHKPEPDEACAGQQASHGSFCWNELLTHDPARAKKFYADTIGWTFDPMKMQDGGTYWVAKAGDKMVAGIFELKGPEFADVHENWMPYIAVDDVDKRVKKATAAGHADAPTVRHPRHRPDRHPARARRRRRRLDDTCGIVGPTTGTAAPSLRSLIMHKVVSRNEWIAARKAHLKDEKAFTEARDRLSAERRALPWVKVEKHYVFDTPSGRKTLGELFEGRSQLIVYHFMLGPDWGEGCPSCSYLADHFDGAALHLAQRDVTFIVVSRAPLPEIEAYMGWKFKWASSCGNDFNFDFHVSFRPEEAEGEVHYNYEMRDFESDEMPGLSVFAKDASGDIIHTFDLRARPRHPRRHLQLS